MGVGAGVGVGVCVCVCVLRGGIKGNQNEHIISGWFKEKLKTRNHICGGPQPYFCTYAPLGCSESVKGYVKRCRSSKRPDVQECVGSATERLGMVQICYHTTFLLYALIPAPMSFLGCQLRLAECGQQSLTGSMPSGRVVRTHVCSKGMSNV